jgi:hypothetical protein
MDGEGEVGLVTLKTTSGGGAENVKATHLGGRIEIPR